MTYKLEPRLSRITSPVVLILAEGKRWYENGMAAIEDAFDKKYRVVE